RRKQSMKRLMSALILALTVIHCVPSHAVGVEPSVVFPEESTNPISQYALSANKKVLVTAHTVHYGTVKVWDWETRKSLTRLDAHPGRIQAVAVSAEGGIFATASRASVRVWDARTCKRIAEFEKTGATVRSLAFSPDDALLAWSTSNHQVGVWDQKGERTRTFMGSHKDEVYVVRFLNAKQLASVSGDGTVKIWDVATGNPDQTLLGHTAEVVALDVSSDGRRLATASWDETVRVWDIEKGKEQLVLPKTRSLCVALSPDG